MIFFSSIWLNQQVHAQGLGYTKLVFKYAYAEDAAAANALFNTWAASKGLVIEKIDTTLADKQEVRAYTFPHQIINIPVDQLDAEYDRRGYPESFRDPAIRFP